MKKIIALFLLLQTGLTLAAQNNRPQFQLNDTNVTVGASLTTYSICWKFDSPELDSICVPYLDSVAIFLKRNPTIKLEIQVHSDAPTCEQEMQRNRKLFSSRAQNIGKYLMANGIDPKRLIYRGYGCVDPIVNETTIAQMPSAQARESAYALNRRVVFKIVGNS